MKRLLVSAAARRDLIDALDHIAADNPAAAERLRGRLREAAARLAEFPGLGPDDGRGRRVLAVPGTRFRLIYRNTDDQIIVLRVYHGARQWPPASA